MALLILESASNVAARAVRLRESLKSPSRKSPPKRNPSNRNPPRRRQTSWTTFLPGLILAMERFSIQES
jgi:hypothetical protein